MSSSELAEITKGNWPAELRALPTEQERLFVQSYVLNGGNSAQACRDAGYRCANARSFATMGSRIVQRERIHDAIVAFSRKHMRTMAPKALQVLVETMDDPNSRERVKAAVQVLDRTDAKITKIDQTVTVKFDPQKESLAYLRHLKSMNAPRDMLINEFGPLGLEHYESLLAKEDVIDVAFVEVETEVQSAEEFLDL